MLGCAPQEDRGTVDLPSRSTHPHRDLVCTRLRRGFSVWVPWLATSWCVLERFEFAMPWRSVPYPTASACSGDAHVHSGFRRRVAGRRSCHSVGESSNALGVQDPPLGDPPGGDEKNGDGVSAGEKNREIRTVFALTHRSGLAEPAGHRPNRHRRCPDHPVDDVYSAIARG
jgi:hypothetical protein